ncbi:MAG: hypothetical protein R2941_07020 [Desulfobacterales bacterium]
MSSPKLFSPRSHAPSGNTPNCAERTVRISARSAGTGLTNFFRGFLRTGLLIFLMCAECPGAEQFGDIRMEVTAQTEGESQHGYFEYRIHLKNDSPAQAHQVKIVFGNPGTSSVRSNLIREMKKTVLLPPRADMRVSLMQPPLPLSGSSARVFIDEVQQLSRTSVPYYKHAANSYAKNRLCVLSSPLVNRDDLFSLLERTAGITEKNLSLIRSVFPPSAWSENWLAFSRYDGILVADTDMKTMPVPVKWALLAYVKCGGTLTVLGEFQLPDVPAESDGETTVYHAGFGQCLVIPVSASAQLSERQARRLHRMWLETLSPWQKFDSPSSANAAFPVAEDLEINVRGLFLGMLIFVIAAGPLNVLVLSRKKKKIWLLWTVPAISLFTCGAVFFYAVFSEGMDSDVRLSAFTILDENRHEAATLGMAAYYCRLTPGEGLRFSDHAELTPIVSQSYGDGTPRTVDWTKDQHLESGWITARIPAHFQIRKYETRRERLQFHAETEPSAVNGLGADILELWVCDAKGRLFHERNIPAGSRKSLNAEHRKKSRIRYQQRLRQIYTDFKWKDPELWTAELMAPGTYIAILDGCPFLEKGLQNAHRLTADGIVFCISGDKG